MPVIPAAQEAEIGGPRFKAHLGNVGKRSYQKNKLSAKGLEAWPSKFQALSSNPSTTHTHIHTQRIKSDF
jgi:hypothetical protein